MLLLLLLSDPIDTRLPRPWDSPSKNTGVGCHFLLQCMKVKEESEKVGLKLNIQKTKMMASGPITSWQIDGETVTGFIFWGSKITVGGDCSHKIKRHLLLGRKLCDHRRQHIKKQRHYFANKGLSSQSYGFSTSHVWM